MRPPLRPPRRPAARPNEVQLEFSFCTVMVARGPAGALRFLRGFYWNVNWQDTFKRLGPSALLPATTVAAGSRVNVGPVFDGRPEDKRFLSILTTPQATNCNQVAAAAAGNPNLNEEAGWPLFDVRR